MEIKISKFAPHPQGDEIQGYAVGFTHVLGNGRSFYLDTLVPIEECTGQTDEQISRIAYVMMKDSIDQQVESLSKKSPIIGTVFTPE